MKPWLELLLSKISAFKCKKRRVDPTHTELENITDQLIDESIRYLERRFYRKLKKASNIDKTFVQETIETLIRDAIAERGKLIGRIEKDIERGSMFDHYYGQMQQINTLTNVTFAHMQRMDAAQNEYIDEKVLYEKAKWNRVDGDSKPNSAELEEARQRNENDETDIYKQMLNRETQLPQ